MEGLLGLWLPALGQAHLLKSVLGSGITSTTALQFSFVRAPSFPRVPPLPFALPTNGLTGTVRDSVVSSRGIRNTQSCSEVRGVSRGGRRLLPSSPEMSGGCSPAAY